MLIRTLVEYYYTKITAVCACRLTHTFSSVHTHQHARSRTHRRHTRMLISRVTIPRAHTNKHTCTQLTITPMHNDQHAHIFVSIHAHIPSAHITQSHRPRDAHAQTHTHARARPGTSEHAHAQELTVIDHVLRTFIGHVMFPHARIANSQWSHDAHKNTRTHSHSSVTLCTRTHASLTPIRAHTQANAQEHELSQSSVIRCTQVHAHALPRACALNGPEAYFYYY